MTTNQERAHALILSAIDTLALDPTTPWFGQELPKIAQALADAQPPILMPDLPAHDGQGRFVGTWWNLDGIRWDWGQEEPVPATVEDSIHGYIAIRSEGDPLLIIDKEHAVDFAHKILAAAHAEQGNHNE